MLFGQAGNDILLGRGGSDLLFGGADDDILTGGDGDDQMFGEAGNDRMIWNPGDDSDLMEGGVGTDTAEVNGGNGAEVFTVTANGTRVRFDRLDPAPFAIDIGTSERLVVNMNGGDDSFSATGNLAALIGITVDGGSGNDTILGSNGADVLLGGDGNDFIDGQQGTTRLPGRRRRHSGIPGRQRPVRAGRRRHDVVQRQQRRRDLRGLANGGGCVPRNSQQRMDRHVEASDLNALAAPTRSRKRPPARRRGLNAEGRDDRRNGGRWRRRYRDPNGTNGDDVFDVGEPAPGSRARAGGPDDINSRRVRTTRGLNSWRDDDTRHHLPPAYQAHDRFGCGDDTCWADRARTRSCGRRQRFASATTARTQTSSRWGRPVQ